MINCPSGEEYTDSFTHYDIVAETVCRLLEKRELIPG
jgi:hypothetical protein